jgi:endo-1,4-beta-mannosidase
LEQKESIFQSILNQAYELMKNRFGNFLVQKLFELGTKDQIDSLANCMKGRILELTCEPFGCHVVQKVLDHVDEAVKSDLVSELFFKIPDTITHKHACHVWQKVFGIRWSQNNSPPIIKHVHESLKGQWAHVALDETGSLLIQNIFENLSEEDKVITIFH